MAKDEYYYTKKDKGMKLAKKMIEKGEHTPTEIKLAVLERYTMSTATTEKYIDLLKAAGEVSLNSYGFLQLTDKPKTLIDEE
jgi:hypothetical protein